MGGPPRNFYSQNSRPARKSSAVQLSHASLIGTQEILQQQHALEEHGTVQFQPRTACKRHTVAQAARPAAEPCLDDARIKAAQPSSPAPRAASPAKADLRHHQKQLHSRHDDQAAVHHCCATWMDGPEAPCGTLLLAIRASLGARSRDRAQTTQRSGAHMAMAAASAHGATPVPFLVLCFLLRGGPPNPVELDSTRQGQGQRQGAGGST